MAEAAACHQLRSEAEAAQAAAARAKDEGGRAQHRLQSEADDARAEQERLASPAAHPTPAAVAATHLGSGGEEALPRDGALGSVGVEPSFLRTAGGDAGRSLDPESAAVAGIVGAADDARGGDDGLSPRRHGGGNGRQGGEIGYFDMGDEGDL